MGLLAAPCGSFGVARVPSPDVRRGHPWPRLSPRRWRFRPPGFAYRRGRLPEHGRPLASERHLVLVVAGRCWSLLVVAGRCQNVGEAGIGERLRSDEVLRETTTFCRPRRRIPHRLATASAIFPVMPTDGRGNGGCDPQITKRRWPSRGGPPPLLVSTLWDVGQTRAISKPFRGVRAANLAACSSPTIFSAAGSHVIERPRRPAMLARWQVFIAMM